MSTFAYHLMKLKHLPGQHDQRSHGSGGSGGNSGAGGSVSILSNQQDAYTTLTNELQNGIDGKLFSRFGEPSALKHVTAHNNEVLKALSNADTDTQQAILDTITADVISNPVHIQAAMALSLFGGSPDIRTRAAGMLNQIDSTAYQTMYPVTYGGGYGGTTTGYIKPTDNLTPRQFYEMNSIDHLLESNPDTFPETMWKIHTTGNVSQQSVALSGMADILTQVGPNREYTPQHSFYPPGVKPPERNARAIALMQQHYDQTQRALQDVGIEQVQLFRGGPLQPGIAVEPWSTSRREATDWAERGKALAGVYQLRTATIPREYILNWYQNPNESNSYTNEFDNIVRENRIYSEREQEYSIAGLGFVNSENYQSESVFTK
jgi:hypothetical protein